MTPFHFVQLALVLLCCLAFHCNQSYGIEITAGDYPKGVEFDGIGGLSGNACVHGEQLQCLCMTERQPPCHCH